eukprot:16442646-Heterocapsa_arctica.AAC.1
MEDFSPSVKAYDLEQVSCMVFDTKEMAEAFTKSYVQMDKHVWMDPNKKAMPLRVVRDSSFDE